MVLRIRLISMRFLYRLLLSSVLILVVGFSACKDTSPVTPIPESTLSVDRSGSLVETRLASESVGTQLLEAQEGFTWIESPQAVLAEEMSYAEANKQIGLNTPQYDLWPAETRVWLVIFKGRWELVPLDPTQVEALPVAYEGCLLILFTAKDASMISVGDSVCPTY